MIHGYTSFLACFNLLPPHQTAPKPQYCAPKTRRQSPSCHQPWWFLLGSQKTKAALSPPRLSLERLLQGPILCRLAEPQGHVLPQALPPPGGLHKRKKRPRAGGWPWRVSFLGGKTRGLAVKSIEMIVIKKKL